MLIPPYLPTMKKDKLIEERSNVCRFITHMSHYYTYVSLYLISAIIITGGIGDWEIYNDDYDYGSELSSVEVFSPSGVPLPCSVPPLPAPRYYHTQDGEVACGGDYYTATSTSCSSLTASGWITSHQLVKERSYHVSWLSLDGLLLIGGAQLSGMTTELLTNNTSSSSPSFGLEYSTRLNTVALF